MSEQKDSWDFHFNQSKVESVDYANEWDEQTQDFSQWFVLIIRLDSGRELAHSFKTKVEARNACYSVLKFLMETKEHSNRFLTLNTLLVMSGVEV